MASQADRWRGWAATFVVCVGLFLIGLDFTVLNVAVPDLQRDLGPSMARTQWIVDGYALTLGGCVLAAGALSDGYGRRRAFVVGLAVCAIASVAGALASTSAVVVAARCGMGLGAALFMPATLSTIAHVFAGAEADRRRAMSLWAAVAGIGAVVGPVAGGWLVEEFSWRAAFWLNLPVALVAIVLALLLVPESHCPGRGGLDRWGAVLCCAGLLSLVWGIIEAPTRGWTNGPVLGAFGGAAVLLVVFVRWETRCAAPMLPVGLLRNARVSTAALALALMTFTVFGGMFLLTLYLQQVRGMSAWEAGVRIAPASLALAVGAAVSGVAARRLGTRTPVAAGLVMIATGAAALAGVQADAGDGLVLAFEVLSGIGGGLVAPVATELLMSAVPRTESGVGSALNDASRQVGSTLGVAVLGSVLAAVSSDHHDSTAVASRQAAIQQAHDAFVEGMTAAAVIGSLVAALGVPLAWFALPASARGEDPARLAGSGGPHIGPDPVPEPDG